YLNIYNNYFKAPWMPDRTEANPNELNQDDARYGFRCCHLKNIWTAPLPPETELSRQMTTSTTSIDIMGAVQMFLMMLVMVSVAAISKTFGLLRFLLRLSFLAKSRLLPHLLTLWVCKLLMLICILTKNVITSCSVTMMLFLHLEVKPLMTLTTVLYLSCALISGHLAMMLMELTKRR